MSKKIFQDNLILITAVATGIVTVDIDGFIGEDLFETFTGGDGKKNTREGFNARLKALGGIEAEEILVNINSPGGDVNHGLNIHDAIASLKGEVTTRMFGMTASAATVIAMAGDKVEMSENALMLVHEARTFAIGTRSEMQRADQTLASVNKRMVSIYSKVSGASEEDITELMAENDGEGRWIDAEEAKELGLINEIHEPRAMAASSVFGAVQKFGYPEIPESKLETLTNYNKMKEETSNEGTQGTETPENKPFDVVAFAKDIKDSIVNAFKADPEDGEEEGEEGADAPEAVSIEDLNAKAEEIVNAKLQVITDAHADEIQGLNGQIQTLTEERDTLQGKVNKLTATGSGADADEDDPATDAPQKKDSESVKALKGVLGSIPEHQRKLHAKKEEA